ncbi:MAG: branched-chain amino acid ABC transporter permease [Acidobacteriota bacterium]
MELLQVLISGLSLGCVYGLIALGFVLIYKATEMVNFAQGDLMMLGAFLGYSLIEIADLPFFLGLGLTILAMAIVGALLERVVLRPMIGEPPFAVLMITIGLGFVLRALAGAIWGAEPKNIDAPWAGGVARWGGAALGHENLMIMASTAILCLLLFAFFRWSRVGLAMQAGSQNQLAAFYVGIPVQKTFALTWALSAAIAGLAGVLTAPISLIDPMMGFLAIKAFAAAIVGGFGSLAGALLGGLLIGVVEQLAGLYLPASIAGVSAYLLFLLVLLLKPEGLFSTMQAKKV